MKEKGKGFGFSPFFVRVMRNAMKSIAILVILLFATIGTKGQVVDSIRYFMGQGGSFMAKFDTRHSFISSRYGRIFGLKFGMNYQDRVSLGGGVNWLTNRSDLRKELNFQEQDTTVYGNIAFWYLSPFFEYTFFKNERWELSMPVRVGLGGAEFTYRDPTKDNERQARSSLLFSYEPVLTAQFKFWRYFGIGTGLGYRLVVLDQGLTSGFNVKPYRFTSPIYIFRFKVFFGRMYRDIFPKKDG